MEEETSFHAQAGMQVANIPAELINFAFLTISANETLQIKMAIKNGYGPLKEDLP